MPNRPAEVVDLRIWRAFVVSAVLMVVSGIGLALYHRPWGAHFWFGTHPERVAWHLGLVVSLGWIHGVFAYLITAAFGWWLLRRARRVGGVRGVGSGCLILAGVVALLALASGHAVPWTDTLPWSDRPSLAPARLDGADGPFAELVGIAPGYDLGRRAGPRVITVVTVFHTLAPLVGGGVLLACLRRGRGPAVRPDGESPDRRSS